jgi:hypothetical protein
MLCQTVSGPQQAAPSVDKLDQILRIALENKVKLSLAFFSLLQGCPPPSIHLGEIKCKGIYELQRRKSTIELLHYPLFHLIKTLVIEYLQDKALLELSRVKGV